MQILKNTAYQFSFIAYRYLFHWHRANLPDGYHQLVLVLTPSKHEKLVAFQMPFTYKSSYVSILGLGLVWLGIPVNGFYGLSDTITDKSSYVSFLPRL